MEPGISCARWSRPQMPLLVSSSGKTARRTDRPRGMLTLLLLIFMCGLLSGTPMAQTRAGSITELRHTANVERSGRRLPAALGMAVLLGDRIETADRSSVTVVLVDGSQITLSDSASAVIDRAMAGAANADSTISLLKGHLHSIVNPRSTGGLPQFIVHTPNAVAAV